MYRNNANSIIVPNKIYVNDSYFNDFYNIQKLTIRHLYTKLEIIDIIHNKKINKETGKNVINAQYKVVQEISGDIIDGSYNITSDSPIRRTCNLTFNLSNKYFPFINQSLFWINKKIHLYIGIANINKDKIYWFDKGIYAIQDPNANIIVNGGTITISGVDKMALFSGDISGQLTSGTIAKVSDNVTREDVIRGIMTDNGEIKDNVLIGGNNIYNGNISYDIMQSVIPYDIESSIGDTVTSVLDKMLSMFANYQYYYSLDGTFIFEPKPTNKDYKSFKTEWVFDDNDNTVISIDSNVDYRNVKNRITVWGGVNTDGYQSHYTLELHNDDVDFGGSPFTIEKLNEYKPDGNILYRDYVEQNDDYIDTSMEYIPYNVQKNNKISYPYQCCILYENKYYICINKYGTTNMDIKNFNNDWELICTQNELQETINKANDNNIEAQIKLKKFMEQIHAYSYNLCKLKAREILFAHCLATETITLTVVPIYSLDVNSVIQVKSNTLKMRGTYVINSISCQLNSNGTMSITASKLWD